MSFLAILFALLLEQARPLGQHNPVHQAVRNWVRWVVHSLDTSKPHHSWLAWWVAVVIPAAVACAVHWLLVWSLGWIAAAVWSIAILYSTLGFRQFSHHFTVIRDALLAGEENVARQSLLWMRMDVSALPRSQIVPRHPSIQYSVHIAMYLAYSRGIRYWLRWGWGRRVRFSIESASICWLCQSAGPTHHYATGQALKSAASLTWYAMDWLPARITALSFAFVGSFEEAVDGWRQHEDQFPGDNDGVILAATAGPSMSNWAKPTVPVQGKRPSPCTCARWWGWCGARWWFGWCFGAVVLGKAAGLEKAGRQSVLLSVLHLSGLLLYLLQNAQSPSLPSSVFGQLCKQVAIYFIAARAYFTWARCQKPIRRFLQRANDPTAWLVQMGAVVKLAV